MRFAGRRPFTAVAIDLINDMVRLHLLAERRRTLLFAVKVTFG